MVLPTTAKWRSAGPINKTLNERANSMALYCIEMGLTFKVAKRQLEQAFLGQLLERDPNQKMAASLMGVSRSTVLRLLQRQRKQEEFNKKVQGGGIYGAGLRGGLLS